MKVLYVTTEKDVKRFVSDKEIWWYVDGGYLHILERPTSEVTKTIAVFKDWICVEKDKCV